MAMMTPRMSRGGNSYSRRRQSRGFSELNVTPLVDVMLVLLVVFMITAPMMTVGVPLDLPKTKAAKLNDQIEPIIVSVDATGRSFLHETELAGEALIARLVAVTQSNPDAKIYVRGDANLAYGRVMEVMGDISAAGFTKVALLAQLPAGTKASDGAAVVKEPAAKKGVIDLPQLANQSVVSQPGTRSNR